MDCAQVLLLGSLLQLLPSYTLPGPPDTLGIDCDPVPVSVRKHTAWQQQQQQQQREELTGCLSCQIPQGPETLEHLK
jgi:hypothetical protein